VIDEFNRHPFRPRACLALTTAAALLGAAGVTGSASAGVLPASGGAGIGGIAAPGTASVLSVGGPRTVSGGGITLDSPPIALLNGTVSFTGTVAQAKAGETVVIQRQGALPGDWVDAASATIGTGGAFAASWRVNRSGSLSVRAVLNSSTTNAGAARAANLAAAQAAPPPSRGAAQTAPPATRGVTLAASPALTLTVFREAVATFFGPGFFGHRTACGQRLTRATIGVASRTLPCGTRVAIYYRGRQLVVPVIDRGPYSRHASWDLTSATAAALGITETVRIGALSPPPGG